MRQLACREIECKVLDQFLTSEKAEFLAIYGRRRVGKTFLIRTYFENQDVIFFDTTGEKNARLAIQIKHFTKQISTVFYNNAPLKPGKNWDESFELLTLAINSSNVSKKIVLFFDELPWMATKNSHILQSLDYYWNQHWSKNSRIKLIVCGSSASWIIDKIVNNKGGLHNRITRNILLEPFNLSKTKSFFRKTKLSITERHIVTLFMVMGGVPFYLSKIEKNLSAIQNIENLAFQHNSFFLNEFNNLFSSLFSDADIIVEMIRIIASYRYGILQDALLKKMGPLLQGKGGLEKLHALEDAGFIMHFKSHWHKKRGIYYRVTDEYCLFYLYWIEPVKDTLLKRNLTEGHWNKMTQQSSWHIWTGLAFESICYKHLPEITRALSLPGIAIPNTWRYTPTQDHKKGAQIDLLFDRDDDAITICEIKYTEKPFVITKAYAEQLQQKIAIFKEVTGTQKQIFIAMISANGVKENQYSSLLSTVLTMKDLFTNYLKS